MEKRDHHSSRGHADATHDENNLLPQGQTEIIFKIIGSQTGCVSICIGALYDLIEKIEEKLLESK